MTEPTVYLNGNFVPLSQAHVPVLDRGFIFGDGIYEVVPAYNRKPFRWSQHLERLRRSLDKIEIDNPMDDEGWTELVNDLISKHPWDNQFVYMQITRGVARRDHAFPAESTPTVFAMSSEFTKPADKLLREGIATITLKDERWLNCDIKSVSLLGNVLAKQAAVQADAMECIMFRDGFMTEGAASTIWVVRNNQVLVPIRDRRILEGIRIGLIESLCQDEGLVLEQRDITREEVLSADELMVSSATKEVLPITSLDGQPVGTGKPGPVFERLYAAYQRAIERNSQA
jgi:D-alanine transaminase